MPESTTIAPSEDELSARIRDLSHADARYALYWLAAGGEDDRARAAEALLAVDRHAARIELAGSTR